MTIYAYIRVSSDKQNCDNQLSAINNFASEHNMKIDKYVQETISSRKAIEKRKITNLFNKLKPSDTLIITEISRLARNLYEIASLLQAAINKNVEVISIKQNYSFKNDLQSKIMAYTFGLAAEIERDLISTRTKMSLEKLKEQNIKLGRPLGAKSKKLKLSSNLKKLNELLNKKISKRKIAETLGVDKTTIYRFIKNNPTLINV
ncbi:MAG: recombinase family protein [Alphaproteobacteria bacterium]|nr:recombinase family protein [Alphaproteobacteria bacterium]